MASMAEKIDRLAAALEREQERGRRTAQNAAASDYPNARARAAALRRLASEARARALAITNLQQARMWVEESLRHNPAPQ